VHGLGGLARSHPLLKHVVADLLPEVLVGGGEVSAEAFVENLHAVSSPARRVGHVNLVGIDGEVDESALLEREDLFAMVAIGSVSMFGVLDGLISEPVLQLGGGYGDAVNAEQEIERLVVLRAVVELTGDAGFMRWAGRSAGDSSRKTVCAVLPQIGDDLPLGGLALTDEGEECGGIEREFGIGLRVAAVGGDVVLDDFFELDFAIVDHTGLSSSECPWTCLASSSAKASDSDSWTKSFLTGILFRIF